MIGGSTRFPEAEAGLVWLNLAGALELAGGLAGEWVVVVCAGVGRAVPGAGADAAHVKFLVEGEGGSARAHLVAANRAPTPVVDGAPVGSVRVLVNALVATSRDVLRAWTTGAIAGVDRPCRTRFPVTTGRA